MDKLSIVPNGLTQPADPNSGKPSRFALFTDSWLELQGYVGAALELPITQGDFEEKYGSLQDSNTIKECINAMRGVKEASTEFGNPKTLRTALIANPNLLASAKPPEEIYTHTIWLGQRVHQTSKNLASNYQEVYDLLQGLPAKEQVQNLKDYLFDQTSGPIPISKQISDEVGALIIKLGKFEQKMNEYNEKLQKFTSDSSNMFQEVDKSIGAVSQQIKDLEKSRDEAYEAWKKFTIAAVTSSVACALIGAVLAPFTGGVSLLIGGAGAIATATGLSIKAVENRVKYNQYCDQIATQGIELKKKQRLRSDLGDFNRQMKNVGPAMKNFLTNLQEVQGIWVQMNNDLLAINNSLDESNVGSSPFMVKLKSKQAIDSWKAIDESAMQFTTEALIDYRSIAFGDKMPENMLEAA